MKAAATGPAASALLFSLAACIDAGVVVPLDDPSGIDFLVIYSRDDTSRVAVDGPFDGSALETLDLQIPDRGGVVRLHLTEDALEELHPRFAPENWPELEWVPAPTSFLEEALCREVGAHDPGASLGGAGKIALSVDHILALASVSILSTGSDRFEPASQVPFETDALAVELPVRSCLEGWRIEIEPFAPAEGWLAEEDCSVGLDSGITQDPVLREVAVLDTDTIFTHTQRTLAVLQRGDPDPILQLEQTELPKLDGDSDNYAFISHAIVVDNDWPEHVRIIAAVEHYRSLDGPPPCPDEGSSIQAIEIVELELDRDGFEFVRSLGAQTRPALAPGSRAQALALGPNRELVAVGLRFIATSTLAGAPMSFTDAGVLNLYSIAWTGDEAEPHLVGGDLGRVHIGSVTGGRAGLLPERPPRANSAKDIRALLTVPERDEWWVASDAPQVFEHTSTGWREVFLPAPGNAQGCVASEQRCGRFHVNDVADFDVRDLVRIPTEDDRTLLLFGPSECKGLYLLDTQAHCAIAMPLEGGDLVERTRSGIENLELRDWTWQGRRGLVVGNRGRVLEVRVLGPGE